MRRAPITLALFVASSVGVGAFGCVARNPIADVRAPVRVVVAVERAIERGELASAHTFVDVEYRLAEVLGAFFVDGSETERGDLVALTFGMFDTTTAQNWDRCCRGRSMRVRLKKEVAGDVWIVSEPTGPEAPKFAWEYRLSQRGSEWRITQRELRVDAIRSDSTRFWPMARRKIAELYGRDPTLAEFNANLPSIQGLLRKRSFVVGSHGR